MKSYYLQASFAGGEVSPDVYGRTDLAKFSVSAKTMKNFYPHFFGGVSNRPGTKFICEVKDSSKKVKLLPFQFSVEQAYVIEAGQNYFRYLKDGGQIVNSGSPVETTTTYAESDLFNLKTAQSADVLYICNSKYKPKTLTRSSHINWTFADFDYKNGPFRTQNSTDTTITPSATTGTGITLTASSSVFTADMVGSLFQVSHDVTGQCISESISNGGTTATIKCKGNWDIVLSGTSVDGTVYLQRSKDKGVTWETLRQYAEASGIDNSYQDSGTIDDLVYLRVTATLTTGSVTVNLNADSFVNDGVVKITSVTSGTVATADVVTDLVGTAFIAGKRNYTLTTNFSSGDVFHLESVSLTASTESGEDAFIVGSSATESMTNLYNLLNQKTAITNIYIISILNSTITLTEKMAGNGNTPGLATITNPLIPIGVISNGTATTSGSTVKATKDWAEGAWSIKNGYPACVKFYQNRLGLAGTMKDPLTFWLSQVGDYPNFLINSPVQDDDSITAPLVSQGVNSIRSMVSLGNMLAFTAGGEWKIGTGSESTALTPTSIRAVQQGYRGSSTLEPLIIGDRVLYCQEMGSVVRDFGYSITDDAYKGDDLTLLAKHLFKNHSIVDWTYQQEPDGIIWAVRDDGVLLSFTYIKEQDVWAWARHETDGYFESVCAIPADDYTAVYFVVKRKINGSYKRYIEQLVPRMISTDPRDQFFVDCGLSYDDPISITGITQANPIVITAVGHGLSAGNTIDLSDIEGMAELNGNRYMVGTVTTDTFTLLDVDDGSNIDGTEFTAYLSGGYVRKCVTTISGLSHLEGKTVTILADGSVHPTRTVSSGSITLDDSASRVHVGLGYTCDLETLNIDLPMRDGTSQIRRKKIPRVNVLFEKSYGGQVGVNGSDNLDTVTPVLSSIMGQPGGLYTGYKEVTIKQSFWSNNATVSIRQTDPLPMTVLSVIPEVVVGDDSTN